MPGAPAPARHWAEEAARLHLLERGLTHLASNYRLRGGELDLVMQDGATVVFVEVKQRRGVRHGHPAEALTPRKLARLRHVAGHYAAFVLGRPDARLRLDAVLVLGDESRHVLEHLEDVGWGA